MLAKIYSLTLDGLSGTKIDVEVDVSSGLPAFDLVGLPDAAIREAKERVRAAIRNSDYDFPMKRVTVNLAPADLRKEGTGFDLGIAISILLATEQCETDLPIKQFALLGELSLDGSLRPINGILPMVSSLKDKGVENVILPEENGREAVLVGGISIYPASTLKEVVGFLKGEFGIVPLQQNWMTDQAPLIPEIELDFAEIKGQVHVKRAVEVAAAGGHNLLMIGPPGSGKTMISQRIPTILPRMTYEEVIETTKIYSVVGNLSKDVGVVRNRPFRAPHHTISTAGLVGGGRVPKPGEVSLAHNGVLFLDELPEFRRDALEVLRQPLEDNEITVARVGGKVTYPSNFMLIASMNPCPCGYWGDSSNQCNCSPYQIQRYMAKISAPLWDRIDIHLEVGRLNYDDLSNKREGEGSAQIRERVEQAREIQRQRFAKDRKTTNAEMGIRQINRYCNLDKDGELLLREAYDKLNLSARGYNRILKLSRTIADLSGCDTIQLPHLGEAIQYRSLDRKYQV